MAWPLLARLTGVKGWEQVAGEAEACNDIGAHGDA
jgi:hypothetical protein